MNDQHVTLRGWNQLRVALAAIEHLKLHIGELDHACEPVVVWHESDLNTLNDVAQLLRNALRLEGDHHLPPAQ